MKCNFISRRFQSNWSDVAQSYFEELNSPVSLSCYILLREKEYQQLLDKVVDPLQYNSSESFRRDYWAVKFLSKFDGFDGLADKDEVAMLAFRKAEVQCAEANLRLDASSLSGAVSAVLHRASEKIERLLPSLDYDVLKFLIENGRFGPGVTSSCKGEFTGVFNKFASANHVTPALDTFLTNLASLLDIPDHFLNREVVRGNRVTTVPKNSKTNRTIAVEPHVNAYFQRSVGVYFRDLLRRWTLDLNDQTKNQKLAHRASISGDFATIDLAMASDTISIEIVRRLLPDHWVYLLESLRSSWYQRDGRWYEYRKHSSMGNGYTFELESLLFSSIVLSVYSYLGIREEFCVYGDDLIVHQSAVPLLLEVLSSCGFTINLSKSHISGYFRESCGSDWFDGDDVTPFYFKRRNDVIQYITFANWLRVNCMKSFPFTWKLLYFSVPKAWANKGPRGGGGTHFHVNEYEVLPNVVYLNRRIHNGFFAYKYTSVRFKPKVKGVLDDSVGVVKASLYSLSKLTDSFWSLFREAMVSGESLSPPQYERKSYGRAVGRWERKSVFFIKDWPAVRDL